MQQHTPDLPADLAVRVDRALRAAVTRISFVTDSMGTVWWVGDSVRSLGYRPEDLVGTHFQDLYAGEDREFSERGYAIAREYRGKDPALYRTLARTARVRTADGQLVTVESHANPFLHDLAIDAVLIEWLLVSDRQLLLAAIDAVAGNGPPQQTQAALAALFRSLVPGIEPEVLAAGPSGWLAVSATTGRHPDGRPVPTLPAPADPVWDQRWVRLAADTVLPSGTAERLQVGAVPLRDADGRLLGVTVLTGRDLLSVELMVGTATENLLTVALRMVALSLSYERVRTELRDAAEHDALTGALNRAGFDRCIAELQRGVPVDVGLVVLALDDFREVNDRFGLAAGDELLVEVVRRLRSCVRDGDLVARVGGDQFALLCHGMPSPQVLDELVRRVSQDLSRPYELTECQARVGVGIGSAHGPSSQLEFLLVAVDADLHQARRNRAPRAAG